MQVGAIETPWTAFSFVCKQGASSSPAFADLVQHKLFPALAEGVRLFVQEGGQNYDPSEDGTDVVTSQQRIMRDHGHTAEDARAWLDTIE